MPADEMEPSQHRVRPTPGCSPVRRWSSRFSPGPTSSWASVWTLSNLCWGHGPTPRRWCQYTSHTLERELRRHGVLASIGSVAHCYDNELAENVSVTLECEVFDPQPGGRFSSRHEAKPKRLRLSRDVPQPTPTAQLTGIDVAGSVRDRLRRQAR